MDINKIINKIKCQGLPVLEAQLKLHTIALDKALKVISLDKSLRLTCLVHNESLDIRPEEITFLFIEETLIPLEFIVAFEQYANRLAAEKFLLEQAIFELKNEFQLQEDLLTAFRNN